MQFQQCPECRIHASFTHTILSSSWHAQSIVTRPSRHCQANQALDESVSIVADMKKSQMAKFIDLESSAGEEWGHHQKKYAKLWCVSAFVASSRDACKGALLRLVRDVEAAGQGEIHSPLVDELVEIKMLLEPPAASVASTIGQLQVCLASTKDEAKLAVVLSQYPQHGKDFMAQAEARFQELQFIHDWVQQVQKTVQGLNLLPTCAEKDLPDLVSEFERLTSVYSSASSSHKARFKQEWPDDEHSLEEAVLKTSQHIAPLACLGMLDLLAAQAEEPGKVVPEDSVKMFLTLSKVKLGDTGVVKQIQDCWVALLEWVNMLAGKHIHRLLSNSHQGLDPDRVIGIINLVDGMDQDIKPWLTEEATITKFENINRWLNSAIVPPLTAFLQGAVEQPTLVLKTGCEAAADFEIFVAARFADTVASSENNAAGAMTRDELLAMESDLMQAADQIDQVAAGAVAKQRSQFLTRRFRLVLSMAKASKIDVARAPSELDLAILVKLRLHLPGFESWSAVAAPHFAGMTADWDLEIGVEAVSKRCVELSRAVENETVQALDAVLKDQAKALKDKTPPKALVENPKLLVEAPP